MQPRARTTRASSSRPRPATGGRSTSSSRRTCRWSTPSCAGRWAAHADVDDVVQETMLRALRQLRDAARTGELPPLAGRDRGPPASAPTCTGGRAAAERRRDLDELAEIPDADADFEGLDDAAAGAVRATPAGGRARPLARPRRPGAAVAVVAGGRRPADPHRTGGGAGRERRPRGGTRPADAPPARPEPRAGGRAGRPAAVRAARRGGGGLGRHAQPVVAQAHRPAHPVRARCAHGREGMSRPSGCSSGSPCCPCPSRSPRASSARSR